MRVEVWERGGGVCGEHTGLVWSCELSPLRVGREGKVFCTRKGTHSME